MNTEYIFDSPREFMLLNATDDWQNLPYDGETFAIPPTGEVVLPNPKAADRFCSGKNSLGEYIAGTLVIKDIYGRRGCPDDVNNEGKRGEFWSARRCIQHALGIDPMTKQAHGVLAKKGVALLPMNPSPDLVAKTRDEARANYITFMEKWAQDTVFAYTEKASKRRSMGYEDTIPGKDYDRALEIISAAKKRRAEKLAEAGITEYAIKPEEDEIKAMMRQMAEEAAYALKADKPETDADAVVEALMEDPKYKAKILEKVKSGYHVRKRRAGRAAVGV